MYDALLWLVEKKRKCSSLIGRKWSHFLSSHRIHLSRRFPFHTLRKERSEECSWLLMSWSVILVRTQKAKKVLRFQKSSTFFACVSPDNALRTCSGAFRSSSVSLHIKAAFYFWSRLCKRTHIIDFFFFFFFFFYDANSPRILNPPVIVNGMQKTHLLWNTSRPVPKMITRKVTETLPYVYSPTQIDPYVEMRKCSRTWHGGAHWILSPPGCLSSRALLHWWIKNISTPGLCSSDPK